MIIKNQGKILDLRKKPAPTVVSAVTPPLKNEFAEAILQDFKSSPKENPAPNLIPKSEEEKSPKIIEHVANVFETPILVKTEKLTVATEKVISLNQEENKTEEPKKAEKSVLISYKPKSVLNQKSTNYQKVTFRFFNVLVSLFAFFLVVVFFGSATIGAIQLKNWLPKLFYSNLKDNSNNQKILIPEFLLKEIDKSKTDPNVYKFRTEHLILRYENINSVVPQGLGATPTITPDNFNSQVERLKTENIQSLEISDFLKKLYFKEESPEKTYSIIFVGGYEGQYEAFKTLKPTGIKALFFIPAGKIGQKGFLTWDQIKEISEAGYQIGAEGYDDKRLGTLEVSEQISQIKDSKKAITQNLNKEVLFFYYPYGSYDADTLAIVRNNGFLGAIGNGENTTQDLEKSLELQSLYNKAYFG